MMRVGSRNPHPTKHALVVGFGPVKRSLRLSLAVVLAMATVTSAPTHARGAPPVAPSRESEANRLVAEGAALAQEGRHDDAIERFRAAERLLPRALHDCNLGLTYSMAGRLPEAHALLARCVARATEALPTWVDTERRRILTELSAGRYRSIIVTTSVPATVTIAPLLPDDTFAAPLTAWLGEGHWTLTAAAAGHRSEVRRVHVDGPGSERLHITLVPASVVSLELRPPELEAPFASRAMPFVLPAPDYVPGWSVLTSGLVAVAVGAVFHGLATTSADAIASRSYRTEADASDDLDVFGAQRATAITSYSLGSVLLLTGIGLLVWPPTDAEAPVEDVP
jgi:hypothetical protein